jgi:excisionase family DNA binding protein
MRSHREPEKPEMAMNKPINSLSIAERLAAGGALSIEEVAAWAGIGRGKAYKEIGAGRLKVTKIGRRTIVRAVDAKAWLHGPEAA